MILASIKSVAFAGGIGFIDYKKGSGKLSYAKEAIKEVDCKRLGASTIFGWQRKRIQISWHSCKKEKFWRQNRKRFKAKQEAYLKLKTTKEEEVYGKIQTVAKQVLVDQKLDAVVDFRVIFVGGVDYRFSYPKLNGGK